MHMIIRKGKIEDIPAMGRIYAAAKDYMRRSGNPNQWNGAYPNEEDAAADIARGISYVAEENGKICGCFVFITGPDPTYGYIEDGAWLDDSLPYGTVHRIASDGTVPGVFKTAMDFCLRITGNVRVDTHEDNKTMQHLAAKYGFTRCGIIFLENGDPRIAFQKIDLSAKDTDAAAPERTGEAIFVKKDLTMDYFKTQYEKLYESEEYYWGTQPADFLDKLLALMPADRPLRVLDIGCGEGKDAVYMAEKGCDVWAFDITNSGIAKTKKLAAARNVEIHAFVADINDPDFGRDCPEDFDIIYSTGTVQYLQEERIAPFFARVQAMTRPGGLNFFNVFVDKPYLELPPDWDVNEKMWRTGDLFRHYADWQIEEISEITFEDNSAGILHYHCMDNIIARKR